jgi:tetratricopeptide (TPR) repeat protein
MRMRPWFAVPLVFMLAAPAAFASFGGGSAPSEPPNRPADNAQSDDPSGQPSARQRAERLYGDAYNDVAKAKQDLDDGKAKDAEKRFRRALDRAKEAAGLDTGYVEAWNLIGFASRKLNDYPSSLAAYQRCLALNPNFAPAREYLGEAYVELGKPADAREQLVWLVKLGKDDDAKTLRAKIEAYEVAHPDSLAVPGKRDSVNLNVTKSSGE